MSEEIERRAPMTVARLREWVAEAKPGARLIYARGSTCLAGCGPMVRNFVQRLGPGGIDDDGKPVMGLQLVSAHFQRGGDGEGQYLVQRTQRPVPRGFVL